MKAIDFFVRTGAGAIQFGEVSGSLGETRIAMEMGSEVFLNLRQSEIAGYERNGSDLVITLADGRVVLIEDYFSGDLQIGRLFISADTFKDERTRDLEASAHYKVTLRIDMDALTDRQRRIEIRPDMQATAELHTGEKTVLQYLLKPLYKSREAFREPQALAFPNAGRIRPENRKDKP